MSTRTAMCIIFTVLGVSLATGLHVLALGGGLLLLLAVYVVPTLVLVALAVHLYRTLGEQHAGDLENLRKRCARLAEERNQALAEVEELTALIAIAPDDAPLDDLHAALHRDALEAEALIETLKGIVERVNDGWDYVSPDGQAADARGVWWRVQDGTGQMVITTDTTRVPQEPMTWDEQRAIYGAVVTPPAGEFGDVSDA